MTFDKSQYLPGIVGLLFEAGRHHAVLPLQFLLADPLLQQGHLPEGGARCDNPPKTWNEVWDAAKKIKASGAAPCGYTSTWLTWIHLENFAAWNNAPYGTNENGLAGKDVELKINAPLFVNHFQALADLAKDGTFKYGGRTSEAKQIFLAGECGIFTESSGGLGDIVKSGMNYGIGQLPYDTDAAGAPQNTTPGGASLWVFGGKSDEEYKGVAAFFSYLSQDRGAGLSASEVGLSAGDARCL